MKVLALFDFDFPLAITHVTLDTVENGRCSRMIFHRSSAPERGGIRYTEYHVKFKVSIDIYSIILSEIVLWHLPVITFPCGGIARP